jgi:CheY-like chemotaxis protein
VLSLQGIELRLKRDVKGKEFTIKTEPYRIRQVLSNLLTNAIHHTESGFVEFGYMVADRTPGGSEIMNLTFYVKDTGSGIPEEKKDTLFDRFRNIDSTNKLKRQGPGIGFPLSKVYIELLGGKMWFQSEAGKGATFYFTIPCQVTNINGHSQIPVKVEKPDSNNGNEFEILVAEDIESNYLLIEAILSKENYRLTWAKNGREAVDRFRENPSIDLILMDLMMPEMTGYEAIAEIKKLNPDVPVIIITAYTRDEDKRKIFETDCVDYITKPIDSVKLLSLIHNIKYENGH